MVEKKIINIYDAKYSDKSYKCFKDIVERNDKVLKKIKKL